MNNFYTENLIKSRAFIKTLGLAAIVVISSAQAAYGGSICTSFLDGEVPLKVSNNQINFSDSHVLNELIVPDGNDNRYTLDDHYQGRIKASLSFVKWAELPEQDGHIRIVGLTDEGKLYFLVKPERDFSSKAKRLYSEKPIKNFALTSHGSLVAADKDGQSMIFSSKLLLQTQTILMSRNTRLNVLTNEIAKSLGAGFTIASAVLFIDQQPDVISRLAQSSPLWVTLSAGLGSAKALYKFGTLEADQSSGFLSAGVKPGRATWFENLDEVFKNKDFFENIDEMR